VAAVTMSAAAGRRAAPVPSPSCPTTLYGRFNPEHLTAHSGIEVGPCDLSTD